MLPPGVTAGDITMTYAADNGVDFALNGTSIGPPTPPPVNHSDWWSSTRTFTATSPPYVVGLNELTATVVNFDGPTGLLVEGTLPTCWPLDAHCVSDGLIVRVAGVDVATLGHAETHSIAPAGARPAGPVPAPPGAPTTSSDGTLLSGSVPLGGGDHLDYAGVAGVCEASLTRPDVYGRAGALDVELVMSALGSLSPIRLTDLMTEAELYLDSGVTGSGITCTTGHATAGTTGFDTCITTSAQVVNIGTVKALVDERWGPYVGSDGFIHYGGTALHLVIDFPLNADVEVIVGSVDLRILAPTPP